MTSSEQEASADERFERLLLDSAEGDELPSHVDAAWQQFDATLKGVSLLAAGAGGALAARRAQRWLATKWLIWGALAGSALTALSLRAIHGRHPEASPTRSAPIAIATVTSVASSAASARVELDAQPARAAATSATTTKGTPHTTRLRPHPLPSHGAATSLPGSTLAAQVALLDAARSANASGAFAEALRLADRYRADFPNGELSPEAEVVAIEALVAQSARERASERAARFLARYPGDPHAARVKWLVR